MPKGQIIIGSITTIGFIALTAFYFFGSVEVAEKLKDPLLLVTGCWITNFTTIVNYLFGSSKGSSDKNDIIKSKLTP